VTATTGVVLLAAATGCSRSAAKACHAYAEPARIIRLQSAALPADPVRVYGNRTGAIAVYLQGGGLIDDLRVTPSRHLGPARGNKGDASFFLDVRTAGRASLAARDAAGKKYTGTVDIVC